MDFKCSIHMEFNSLAACLVYELPKYEAFISKTTAKPATLFHPATRGFKSTAFKANKFVCSAAILRNHFLIQNAMLSELSCSSPRTAQLRVQYRRTRFHNRLLRFVLRWRPNHLRQIIRIFASSAVSRATSAIVNWTMVHFMTTLTIDAEAFRQCIGNDRVFLIAAYI